MTYFHDEPWDIVLERFIEWKTCEDVINVQSEYFDNKGTFLVVLDNERVIGSGAIQRISGDICDLGRFYLKPEYQNQGIGTKLLCELFDFAIQAGYVKIQTSTYKESERAYHLFQKHGFDLIKSFTDDEKEYDDSPDYTLEKVLTDR